MKVDGFALKVWISICNYVLHPNSDVSLRGAKGLKSFDRFFAEFILSPIISGPKDSE
jgi:hypothetical protein